MLATRALGLSHLYVDSQLDGFSNTAVGMVVRAVGAGLKVAYINVQGRGKRFTNFLENLSLSHAFVKRFDRFHIECFDLTNDTSISKSILPLVEFHSISDEMFWKSLDSFDCVIFDDFTSKRISKFKVQNYIQNRNPNTEVIFVTNSDKEANSIKDNFDYVVELSHTKSPLLNTQKNIMNIFGKGRGKSTYVFGYIIRKFLEKHNVKLIYFDKEGQFYSERPFFAALKKWMFDNSFYGSFDFVETGIKRYEGKEIRTSVTPEDIREGNEALMLLRTALQKQTPVIAEELNDAIEKGIIKEQEVIDILDKVSNELIITGTSIPSKIKSYSNSQVEVSIQKAPSKLEQRKGIDF